MVNKRNMQKKREKRYSINPNIYFIGTMPKDTGYIGVIQQFGNPIARLSEQIYPTHELAKQAARDQVHKVGGKVFGE